MEFVSQEERLHYCFLYDNTRLHSSVHTHRGHCKFRLMVLLCLSYGLTSHHFIIIWLVLWEKICVETIMSIMRHYKNTMLHWLQRRNGNIYNAEIHTLVLQVKEDC